jgi:uncharacterized oligopeptide transporter (OPT) family protein
MQDLKTGHLLGAAPQAQFLGQVIGATVGAVVSALVYGLYTSIYETIPNDLFQAPTALVWIFTARLVAAGKGLPPMATEFAVGAFVLFAIITAVKMSNPRAWYIPGGLAVAVGKFNVILDFDGLYLFADPVPPRNVQCAVSLLPASAFAIFMSLVF